MSDTVVARKESGKSIPTSKFVSKLVFRLRFHPTFVVINLRTGSAVKQNSWWHRFCVRRWSWGIADGPIIVWIGLLISRAEGNCQLWGREWRRKSFYLAVYNPIVGRVKAPDALLGCTTICAHRSEKAIVIFANSFYFIRFTPFYLAVGRVLFHWLIDRHPMIH